MTTVAVPETTQPTFDPIKASGQFLLVAIVLGFFRIGWVIGESSGLFGSPPDSWIGDFSALLGGTMYGLAIVGLASFVEVYRRQRSDANQPIAPLILNYFGIVLMLAFTERVAYVAETNPQDFIVWAGLGVNGVIRGGVYALIALGYTLVYGILFMINFAHGEVMMFGAYAGYLAMMFMIDGGANTFESGAAQLATFFIPVIIGIMFLPLESFVNGYSHREQTNFQTPSWLFTFFSSPMRFFVGVAIGYGALVGLGGYAPHVYLLVITVVGILFVVVCGMIVSMLLSIVLERVAYRPLRNAPRLAPLISAIGASFFLQQVALRMFGPNRKAYESPQLLADNFRIGLGDLGVLSVSKVGVLVVITSFLLMLLLYIIVQRTKIGKAMRAVSQDKETSALMGIDVDRVIVFTFMLGAALAGAAGTLLGLRGEDIDFKFGFTPGIKAFTAAVLGGIGNIPGAMFGGLFLGIVEALGPQMLGFEFKWQNVIAFSLLVIVIIFRPTGIFGDVSQIKKV